MNTDFERLTLPIDGAFTISRGSKTEVETVVVRVSDDAGQTGVGAAAPDPHYGETVDTVCAVLPDLLAVVADVDDPLALDRIERRLRETVRDNPAARAAVSIACHDLATRRLGVPLYRHFGLDAERAPPTSYTVPIDDPDAMGEQAADAVANGYEILKVKLGADRDRERMEAVRAAAPDATIRVDANEAWTPHEAVAKSDWLADLGVEFVEQPVPAENPAGLRQVHERSALPIAADESCVTLPDVPAVADRADIVNLKLMKCGGVREAVRMVHAARAHGLEVMLGCMVESTASIAAACHLAPLVDHVDLDGALLLAEDAYEGPTYDGGTLTVPDRPGTGVRPV
ncbi:dipeptide epimerase [Haloplanus aerogenes]|uniref:Dipeptide epimerase n=1 Tax=Haloplanus aerogenes TaxID=660522 RepID=A0A3M0CHR9_9EURY|nr:dipeptide epimerase [Haloplanus aerogenes]AZH26785.1 dipeptide epimerase [Haloplanus aerogenes]RMB09128.1 L-alanine-DL-glutamate epimerase-like enolase superfamily enzyme [Haloplanus aerogenes]